MVSCHVQSGLDWGSAQGLRVKTAALEALREADTLARALPLRINLAQTRAVNKSLYLGMY